MFKYVLIKFKNRGQTNWVERDYSGSIMSESTTILWGLLYNLKGGGGNNNLQDKGNEDGKR